jgi:exopolysaccharide/PEP-CTERM locus tyrosine autokinase
VRDPCREIGKQKLRVFGAAGGVIGRSADCYWVLPDPKSFVSGHHCTILSGDGAFWLRDTSRNGVFLNGSQERVGFGHKIKLNDGDRLALGEYRIYVSVNYQEQSDDVSYSEPSASSDSASQSLAAAHAGIGPVPPEHTEERGAGEPTVEPVADTGSDSPPEHWAARTQAIDPALVDQVPDRVIKIDVDVLRSAGLLPVENQGRLTANQFRKIKRPVIARAFGRDVAAASTPNGRLVMIASALPGEGKTFCTLNLALSIARERDISVVLVDADLPKPHLSSILGLQDEPGLLNALADDTIEIESLILPTDVERLSVLPAGQCGADLATELLASTRMEDLVGKMAPTNPRRIIIFDSPPLLITSESQVLAGILGQVVLVVRAGVTPRAAVTDAVALIGEDTPVGLVLNQCKMGAGSANYGYGAYGYGSYGNETSPPAT